MIQNYKIVERLKAGRTHSSLGIQMAPSALEIEAASLIQELGDTLGMARYMLSMLAPMADQSVGEAVKQCDAAISKLKEA